MLTRGLWAVGFRVRFGMMVATVALIHAAFVVTPAAAKHESGSGGAPSPAKKGDYVFVIDKYKCTLTVHRNSETGPIEHTCEVSVGRNLDLQDKQAKGDFRTPEGNFTIQSIHPATDWLHNGVRAYGPWFLRLKTPGWSGIGIHGTNEGNKLGKPASDGCIRLATAEISLVKERYAAVGGAVIVHRGTPPGWSPPSRIKPGAVAIPADGLKPRRR